MIKGLSPPQGKRMVSPKDLEPKIHERIGLRAHETRGRKKRPNLPRSEDQREFRTGPGSLEAAKSSGSLGHAAELRLDRDNSKGVPKKHKE